MAPLSVLPGRLRFEASCLIGNRDACDCLEEKILSVQGVSETSSSHRTGRVLVRFDESVVSRIEIEGHLCRALQEVSVRKEKGAGHPPLRRSAPARGDSASGVGHFVMEMALHAFLPAPLDLLLPTAAAFRR